MLSILRDSGGCELDELESDQQKALLHFASQIDGGSAELIAERWLREFKEDFQNVLQDLGTAAQRAVGFGKGAEQLIKNYGANTYE